jgi:hypothetical protein
MSVTGSNVPLCINSTVVPTASPHASPNRLVVYRFFIGFLSDEFVNNEVCRVASLYNQDIAI